jgi:hypothetical protein
MNGRMAKPNREAASVAAESVKIRKPPTTRIAKKLATAPAAVTVKAPAVPKTTVQKPAAAKTKPRTAKAPATKTKTSGPSREQIALRAYFISEKRRTLGLPGNEHQDWLQAEAELVAEAKRRKKAAAPKL